MIRIMYHILVDFFGDSGYNIGVLIYKIYIDAAVMYTAWTT